MMTLKELFGRLGGQRSVADALGVGATAVSNWAVQNRLPAAHYLALWRMALEGGHDWEPPGAAELRPLLAPPADSPAASAAEAA